MAKYELRRKVKLRMRSLRKCILQVWDRILVCSLGKPIYQALQHPEVGGSRNSSSKITVESLLDTGDSRPAARLRKFSYDYNDSDLVTLKIVLLGDFQIGKTRFMEKYVGHMNEELGNLQGNGLNLMGKTLIIRGARISYNIWEVEGRRENRHQISVACNDAVAILFMFDLTRRITLNSVISWYEEARKCNQTATPIIVGTKFDEFIQLPIDLQWTIASQARTYAKALSAPLFFSSSTYNINVNKVFKFITAKLFDLPWPLQRNLTVGEPIIDF